MVLLCSDEGRATLEAFVAGREPQSPRRARGWETRPLEGPDELQAQALQFLLALYGYPACTNTVSQALASGVDLTKIVAVSAIREAKDVSFLDRLAELSESVGDALAETIAKTLGHLGDVRAEPPLLRLLGSGSESVWRAAAEALGKVGTIRAVESLYPLTERMLSLGLETTAREAIARIQARLGDAEAGQLSLHAHAPAEGGVSIAQEAGGPSLDRTATDRDDE